MRSGMLDRYAPPGIDPWREAQRMGWGLLAAAVYSGRFLIAYSTARGNLFQWEHGKKILIEGAVMPDFAELFSGSFAGLWMFAICMAAVAAWHIAYHYQGGSRSVYLMRRLPDRWEYGRRCLTLPALGVLAAVCVAALLTLAYFAIYLGCTPKSCLTPGQWGKLWGMVS